MHVIYLYVWRSRDAYIQYTLNNLAFACGTTHDASIPVIDRSRDGNSHGKKDGRGKGGSTEVKKKEVKEKTTGRNTYKSQDLQSNPKHYAYMYPE